MVHVIFAKSALFLVSGRRTACWALYDLRAWAGCTATQPLLAALFLVPALALAGIPPLSGFWAKLRLVQAGLDAGSYAIVRDGAGGEPADDVLDDQDLGGGVLEAAAASRGGAIDARGTGWTLGAEHRPGELITVTTRRARGTSRGYRHSARPVGWRCWRRPRPGRADRRGGAGGRAGIRRGGARCRQPLHPVRPCGPCCAAGGSPCSC